MPLETDDEDCAVAVDFHATGLSVNTVLNTHGDADPSWSGTIAKLFGKYFEQRNIPNLLGKFDKIHHLKGGARRNCLRQCNIILLTLQGNREVNRRRQLQHLSEREYALALSLYQPCTSAAGAV